MLVLLLKAVCKLPNLWLSPSAFIPKEEQQDQPIYNYTYSGLNALIVPTTPPKAMQFGRALPQILHRIVNADPQLGPVFMSKTDPV